MGYPARVCLVLFIASVACSRERPIKPLPPELRGLYGSWEWLFACGDFGGTLELTRDSGGGRHRHRYTFRPDGTYERFAPGVVAEQGDFSVEQDPSFNDDGSIPILRLDGEEFSGRVIVRAGPDTLILGDTDRDHQRAYYVRVSTSDDEARTLREPLPCPR